MRLSGILAPDIRNASHLVANVPRLVKKYVVTKVNEYKAKSFESLPVCFIVSTGRTGTQFFETFFNQNFPEVLCLHEATPDGFYLGIGKIREGLQTEEVVYQLRASRVRILPRLKERNAKLYIESNPFFSLLIPELRKAFPDSRFLWIVRDPRTYVVSAYNKSPTGDNKSFFYAENDPRRRITALDFPDDKWCSTWSEFDRFQRICWYWNKCNEILERDLADRNDFLLMKFEDLFNRADDHQAIRKVLRFFQIEVPPGMDGNALDGLMRRTTNSSSRTLWKGVEDWTDEQKMHVDTLTYPMRTKLGY